MSKRYRRYLYLTAFVLAVYVFAVLYAAYLQGTAFYYGLLLLLPGGVFIWYLLGKMRYAAMVEKLAAGWAKVCKRERDFQDLAKMSLLFPVDTSSETLISPLTKEDLHLDLLYGLVDRTLTTPGAQVLYNMLQRPLFNAERLAERGQAIRLFDSQPQLRQKLLLRLQRLDRQKADTVTNLVWDEAVQPARLGYLPAVLAALALAAVISPFFLGFRGVFFGIFPMFALNFVYVHKKSAGMMISLPAIRYLNALILAAGDLAQLTADSLPAYAAELTAGVQRCKGLLRKTHYNVLRLLDAFGLYDYFNYLFLLELRRFEASMAAISREREHLQQLYLLVGELDALLAVSSLRAGQGTWAEPELVEDRCFISAEEIYHPLLEQPVANSVQLPKPGAIITGSNMSGKSTFLRTIGVNALFAQTIYTCFAKSYRAGYFAIVTSINKDDYLPGGKSYFLSEAEAILAMLNNRTEKAASLCIIDEIFRGTHSLERIPAAIAVLRYLAKQNTLSVIATHDLEVAKACTAVYTLYHFSEQVGEGGLEFDYRLKNGLTTSWNAIRILQHLGFPAEIVEQAAAAVEKEIKWTTK
ncbi:MAG TPA: hypothetical protein DCE00_04250 [Firmicutes bacterium]|jgi:hypothetical protein|nr:hypothetical protein [Bacillota bacterium]